MHLGTAVLAVILIAFVIVPSPRKYTAAIYTVIAAVPIPPSICTTIFATIFATDFTAIVTIGAAFIAAITSIYPRPLRTTVADSLLDPRLTVTHLLLPSALAV
jgi:hypothetical protein